jgi:predicted Ser/Thr protein kinase
METERICPNCRKPLPQDVPLGLCPECLIKSGFPTGTDPLTAAGAGFVPPPVEEIASLFPQLEILGLIGRGGMGAVYKARQPALNRFVALKVLPPAVARDAGFAERFNREAQALARLNHPNIVAVHDFGKAGPLHYLVMEFVDGTNLREVERAGKLSPEQAMAIVPQICEALQFAHNEGVVHRDIKPENILVDTKGRVKITDFGIAKILGVPAGRISLTGARDVVGTPHYMAPEQIERPQEVDHRADIYSLGVVFYEMLTGELPLGKFAPPSRKVQMDVRLDEVVLHTLEKEPERRYQHVSQVKTDVETIATTAPPPGGGFQPAAGFAPPSPNPPAPVSSDKGKFPALLLAFFFGVLGAHRFYVGKIWTALAQLFALGACVALIIACATLDGDWQPALGVILGFSILGCMGWALIDCLLILCGAFTDGQGKRTARWFHADAWTPGVNPPGPPPAIVNIMTAPSTAMITAPAVALMVAGGWKLLSACKGVFVLSWGSSWLDDFLGIGHFFGGFSLPVVLSILVFDVVPALLIMYGGFEMLERRSYAWAMAAAIISIVACSLVGFPVGIWALIVLSRADVRLAFASAGAMPPHTGLFWRRIAFFASCIVAVAILAALGCLIVQTVYHIGADASAANSLVEEANGEFRKESNQTFPLDENGSLALDNITGRIEIHGWSSNAVAVHAVIHGKSAKHVEDVSINIDADRHKVSIHTDKPSREDGFSWDRLLRSGSPAAVDYTIQAPRHARLRNINSVSGRVAIDGISGSITASTVNGETRIKDAASDLKLSTVNGRIVADMASLGGNQVVSLDAVNGSMELTVPTNADASFSVNTLNGRITSEFPSLVAVKEFPIGHNLKGRLGNSSATVKASAVNGSFKVLQSKGTNQ